MVIGGKESTGVGIRVHVQNMDIIKEVVVHGSRGALPMYGAGSVIGSEIMYTSTCGKHGLMGISGGLSYLNP